MNSLIEEAKVVNVLSPASRSSAATGDWINMKNYDKVTFVIPIGAVTAGGNVKVLQAKDVSGTSGSTVVDFATYHKMTAASDTYTETSANSSGSHSCITVGNSSDSKIFIVEVNAAQLSASFDCVTVNTPVGFSACLSAVVGIAHKARYAQDAPPSALS